MAKKPNIRFVGFEDDWEQRKLGATNTFFTDGNYGEAYPKLSDMTDSGSGVPFLTGGNLKDGKLSLDGASYITPEKHSKLTSGHLLEDDIVIAVRGSLGALGYVNTDNSGWNINSQLAILRTDKSELYGKFLIQYLLSWTGQNELLKRQTGSALKQLPIGAIKDVEVPITSIAEQEKIGEYFADLDNLITLHQRKCDELKKVKKFMLQKMFPKKGEKNPEIRFDGFTNDWEQRKLGEIMVSLQNNTLSRANLSNETGIAKNVHYGDVLIKFGEVLDVSEESLPMISDEGVLTKYKASFLQNGDVIVADTAEDSTVGKCCEIAGLNDEVVLSGLHTIPYRPIEKFASGYLGYYLNSSAFHKQLIPLMQGIKVTSISKSAMQDTDIIYTKSLEEQGKIGNFFQFIDHLITLHQRKCEELKNVKKYMLQNMFAK